MLNFPDKACTDKASHNEDSYNSLFHNKLDCLLEILKEGCLEAVTVRGWAVG